MRSVSTGLAAREEMWVTIKGIGPVLVTSTFSDYRPVAGVPLPFRVESTSAVTGTLVTHYTDIKPAR